MFRVRCLAQAERCPDADPQLAVRGERGYRREIGALRHDLADVPRERLVPDG